MRFDAEMRTRRGGQILEFAPMSARRVATWQAVRSHIEIASLRRGRFRLLGPLLFGRAIRLCRSGVCSLLVFAVCRTGFLLFRGKVGTSRLIAWARRRTLRVCGRYAE
jgi:hypothetical protein